MDFVPAKGERDLYIPHVSHGNKPLPGRTIISRRTKIVVAIVTVAATVAFNLCRSTLHLTSHKDVRASAPDTDFNWFDVSTISYRRLSLKADTSLPVGSCQRYRMDRLLFWREVRSATSPMGL